MSTPHESTRTVHFVYDPIRQIMTEKEISPPPTYGAEFVYTNTNLHMTVNGKRIFHMGRRIVRSDTPHHS